jgi:hypothetical protein
MCEKQVPFGQLDSAAYNLTATIKNGFTQPCIYLGFPQLDCRVYSPVANKLIHSF